MEKNIKGSKDRGAPKMPQADTPWPAYTVVKKPIGWLKPSPRNARTHSPEQIEQIRGSLRQFGWTMPALAREDGTLIAGNGRLAAALLEGITEIPVIIATGWTESQCRAYALADNKIALNSDWDNALLGAELAELGELGIDLGSLGFDADELSSLFGLSEGLTDPDEVPEVPVNPVSRAGDLWILGGHRLLAGDSTKEEDVKRVMGDAKAVLMAIDPPYGVAYDNAERPNPGVAKPRVAKPRVANDEIVDGPEMQRFLEAMLKAALPYMDDHAAYYFWHPMLTQGTYAAAAAAAGILIHRQIIWVKPGLLLGRGDYHWRHELCFYGWQKGNRPPFYGPRNQDTIWEVSSVSSKERAEMGHATPKPVALWDKPIANHTRCGEVLYESFSGSGTQIIAAERSQRRCFAIEIDPSYVDCGVLRWQKHTGEKAVLEGDGRTFEESIPAQIFWMQARAGWRSGFPADIPKRGLSRTQKKPMRRLHLVR